MTDKDEGTVVTAPIPTLDGPEDLQLRLSQLEAAQVALESENKNLRYLIESVIAHRQKSHTELVLLLTNLVSKLQMNEVGVIISKLVEHNTSVNQYLAALTKGTAEAPIPEPSILKTLDHTKKDLRAGIAPQIQALVDLNAPIEPKLLQDLASDPEVFFSPPAVRAWRCFVKGQIPRERIVREFGETALCCFRDKTTDPKLNPRPKPEEIVLTFRGEAETIIGQDANLSADQKEKLLALAKATQDCKGTNAIAPAAKAAFQKLSFLIELLHYYDHQNTEPAEVTFAQRLPALIEQLAASQEALDEPSLLQAEELLAHIINPDHRQMVINNIGKGGGTARTLKFVLAFRSPKVEAPEPMAVDFVRDLLPSQPAAAPSARQITSILRLLPEAMQKRMLRTLSHTDRLRKAEAGTLAKAIAANLGIESFEEEKPKENVPPEQDREMAWARIKDMVTHRTDPATLAKEIRERLNSHYDADEIRQSWIVLTEADPMSFIRVFCLLPYLANGKTDPIAKPVMETYLSRLTHEKYASTYSRLLTSLKNIFRMKADSPTLLTFMALVRWASPEAATKIATDVGMPA